MPARKARRGLSRRRPAGGGGLPDGDAGADGQGRAGLYRRYRFARGRLRGYARAMADECHILVVEDDPRLRERLARYLVGEGFRVTAAGDAADARAKLRAINPDLLVLDV